MCTQLHVHRELHEMYVRDKTHEHKTVLEII